MADRRKSDRVKSNAVVGLAALCLAVSSAALYSMWNFNSFVNDARRAFMRATQGVIQ